MRYFPQDNVRLWDKLAYSFGILGKNIAHGLIFVVILVYCVQVLHLRFSFLTSTYLLSLLIESAFALVLGLFFDHCQRQINKYKTWIIIGTVTTVISSVSFILLPTFSHQLFSHHFALLFICINCCFLFIQLPYLSLISSFSSNATTRNITATMPNTGNFIGRQLICLTLLGLIGHLDIFNWELELYYYILLFACVLLACSQICFIFCIRYHQIHWTSHVVRHHQQLKRQRKHLHRAASNNANDDDDVSAQLFPSAAQRYASIKKSDSIVSNSFASENGVAGGIGGNAAENAALHYSSLAENSSVGARSYTSNGAKHNSTARASRYPSRYKEEASLISGNEKAVAGHHADTNMAINSAVSSEDFQLDLHQPDPTGSSAGTGASPNTSADQGQAAAPDHTTNEPAPPRPKVYDNSKAASLLPPDYLDRSDNASQHRTVATAAATATATAATAARAAAATATATTQPAARSEHTAQKAFDTLQQLDEASQRFNQEMRHHTMGDGSPESFYAGQRSNVKKTETTGATAPDGEHAQEHAEDNSSSHTSHDATAAHRYQAFSRYSTLHEYKQATQKQDDGMEHGHFKAARSPIQETSLSLSNILLVFFKNDQLMIMFLIGILQYMNFSLMYTLIFEYFSDQKLITSILGISCVLLGMVGQVASMLFFPKLALETRRTKVFIHSTIIMCFAFVLLVLLQHIELDLLFVFIPTTFLIFNIGMGLAKVAMTTMVADTVDYGEFKISMRNDALVFAYFSSSYRLGTFIAGAILFTSNMSDSFYNSVQYIMPLPIDVIFEVFIVSSVLSVVLYMCKHHYKLNGAFYRNILNSLQFLRQNQQNYTPNAHTVQKHFMLRYSLDANAVIIKLKANNESEMIQAMVQKLSEVNAISSEHDYMCDLKARLALGPCGIAEGIAIPHAKSSAVRRATVVVATLDQPLDLGASDHKRCDLIFLLASPDDGTTHMNLLGRLSLLLNEPSFADRLRAAGSSTELFERLIKCEKNIVN